jgi:hypothetical protein
MKIINTNLLEELKSSETTLALMVRIIRKDNQVYNFTNFNKDIEYNGATYKSSNSFLPTSFQQVADLSVDTLEVTGYYDSLGITQKDLLLELFYDAKIWVFIINYKDKDQGEIKLLHGSLGQATIHPQHFSIEFRNLTYKLTRKLANLFSKTCRAEFGDSKCGVSLSPVVWQAATVYEVGDAVTPSVSNGRRYECITAGVSDSIEPTWSTTINDTVSETTGVVWRVRDSIKKSISVISPYVYRLYIKKASDPLNIKEVKFFDSTDTRIYPVWCESTPFGNCNNTQDNNPLTEMQLSFFTAAYIAFYFGAPGIDFKNIEILLNSSSYIEEFELQVSYDGATLEEDSGTWETIYSFKSTAAYWSSISYNLVVPSSQINFIVRDKFNVVNPYDDVSYLNNGLITCTTGNNAGFSMEIKEFDEENNVLNLFKSLPYNINYGDTFEVTSGCNHLFLGNDGTTSTGDCVAKYNNGKNFRGEPYIPTEDVLVGGIGETNRKPNT